MPILPAAFLLGSVAGLRTLTAPAVLWLMRHRSPGAYLLGLLALFEYAADLYPKAPPRTQAVGLFARAFSGGFCGWAVTASTVTSPIGGIAYGAAGALAGAYAGLWARRRAIASFGPIPAALAEDALAIAGAVSIVAYA